MPALTTFVGRAGEARMLVLDNCEHVLGAAAELCGFMLPTVNDLTVLATASP